MRRLRADCGVVELSQECCAVNAKNEVTLVERDAIRAIILTPENEVLLLRIHPPDDEERFWWITPGGGREPGEAVEDALKRELQEELCLKEYVLGQRVGEFA